VADRVEGRLRDLERTSHRVSQHHTPKGNMGVGFFVSRYRLNGKQGGR
jgi:hypothetical protein